MLVVNESFAKRYFADGRVLGRRILVQSSNQALAEIVGVVGDVRHNGLTLEPVPTVFWAARAKPPVHHQPGRATLGSAAHAAAIRRAIHEADPMQAVSAVGTLEQDVAKVLARPRLQAHLVTAFSAIAVILALIGVYGIVAYVVTQRTREIGIRLVLGATNRRIFGELLAEGARLVVGGLIAGVAASLLLRQIISTMLGVSRWIPSNCWRPLIPSRRLAAVGLQQSRLARATHHALAGIVGPRSAARRSAKREGGSLFSTRLGSVVRRGERATSSRAAPPRKDQSVDRRTGFRGAPGRALLRSPGQAMSRRDRRPPEMRRTPAL